MEVLPDKIHVNILSWLRMALKCTWKASTVSFAVLVVLFHPGIGKQIAFLRVGPQISLRS